MKTPSIALIACEVFRDEIEAALMDATHVRVLRYYEIGLHDRPLVMRATLQEAVDTLESRHDIDAITLAYGLCGLGTADLRAGRHPLVIPRAHDCIGVFLGGADRHAARQRACPGCHYYTAGWNRARRVPGPDRVVWMRAQYTEQFDDETAEYLIEQERELWKHYDTAAFIDTGAPGAEENAAFTRQCAESLGWNFERLAGDPEMLRALLWGAWDERRFLFIRPSERSAATADSRVMHAIPNAAHE